jgi:hypothetical protein
MQQKEIETVIDRLLELVYKRGKTTIREAAMILALDQNQIEKMALLLESQGLIDVSYTLIGTVLSKKSAKESLEFEQPLERIFQKKNTVEEESKEIKEDLLSSESLTRFVEWDIKRRIDRSDRLLNDLERRKLSEDEIHIVEKHLQNTSIDAKKIIRELTELKYIYVHFNAKMRIFTKRIKQLEKKFDKARAKRAGERK